MSQERITLSTGNLDTHVRQLFAEIVEFFKGRGGDQHVLEPQAMSGQN